jgi:hypothetical protein
MLDPSADRRHPPEDGQARHGTERDDPASPPTAAITREEIADGLQPYVLLDEVLPLDVGLAAILQAREQPFARSHESTLRVGAAPRCVR